jgi:hypothetical protein
VSNADNFAPPSEDDPRRCAARKTDGSPCKKWAISGATV